MQRIKILIFFILFISTQIIHAQKINYKKRASFVYRYMNFIEWPAISFTGADFVIGVYGDKDRTIAKKFKESLGIRTLFRRRVTVKRISKAKDVTKDCQAVFIPKGSIGQADIPKFLNYPILIFTEAPGLGQKGSSINFIGSGSDYEINIGQMKRCGLKWNPKLVKNTVSSENTASEYLIDPEVIRKQKEEILKQKLEKEKSQKEARKKPKPLKIL